MQIEYKIRAFCNLLVSLNWEIVHKERERIPIVRLLNKTLYDETIEIAIFKNYNSPDFSRQALLTIQKAMQIDERIINKPQTHDLIIFLNNYQRHYSKVKNDWIIPEPNSKYTDNEIPNIYIP